LIICPRCEESEMNMMTQFNSDTKRLEITLECISPTCPARFFGILYETAKEVDKEATEKYGRKKKKTVA
jgi:hypothetical protein